MILTEQKLRKIIQYKLFESLNKQDDMKNVNGTDYYFINEPQNWGTLLKKMKNKYSDMTGIQKIQSPMQFKKIFGKDIQIGNAINVTQLNDFINGDTQNKPTILSHKGATSIKSEAGLNDIMAAFDKMTANSELFQNKEQAFDNILHVLQNAYTKSSNPNEKKRIAKLSKIFTDNEDELKKDSRTLENAINNAKYFIERSSQLSDVSLDDLSTPENKRDMKNAFDNVKNKKDMEKFAY